MKVVALVLLCLTAISCGKTNKSGKTGKRFLDPLEGAAICQGPAQLFSLEGTWSDYVEGVEDFIDLRFERSGRLTLTLACQGPDGGFFTDSTSTNYQVGAAQVSVNNHQPVEVQTGGLNCELENMGGRYTYSIQGQCLVLNNGQRNFFFAFVD